MGIIIIIAVLLILGTVFNRMMRVDPTPQEQQPAELKPIEDAWSRLENIHREIENGGNKEFVNSERGQNAPPVYGGYNNDSEVVSTMTDSSEKVLRDFSPETYVFGESFQNRDMNRETIESDLEMAKAISFNVDSKLSNSNFNQSLFSGSDLKSDSELESILSSSKNRKKAEVNFNFRDAVIFSAILNPKFKEENPYEREILI